MADILDREDDTQRRVVVVLASYAPSLVLFRAALLTALTRRNYRVVAAGPPCADTEHKLRTMGVEYARVVGSRTSLNPVGDVSYFLRLTALLRRLRPVAIISYTAKPVIWGSLAATVAGVSRRLAMVTGIGSILADRDGATRGIARILMLLYRAALGACHRVAFQNPDDQADFIAQRLVAPGKCFQVNGSGVPLEQFKAAPVPQQPVFLLIARLIADKGIREYAAAARVLKQRFPAARFRLVGWFDENPTALRREEVDEWVALGHIEYAGHLSDVRPEIAAAMVYVLPSYREGTPRTVLEAMAMGRAIVTTDVPGCRQTVQDGSNGYLVPARDVDALAAAMERFLLNPSLAVTMGERSRELALSKFDADKVALHLVEGFGL